MSACYKQDTAGLVPMLFGALIRRLLCTFKPAICHQDLYGRIFLAHSKMIVYLYGALILYEKPYSCLRLIFPINMSLNITQSPIKL